MNKRAMGEIEKHFEICLNLLKDDKVPKNNTLVLFMKKGDPENPICIYPGSKESLEEFMDRAHGLRKDFNPDISIVINRNEKEVGDGRITVAHHESRKFRMFIKQKDLDNIMEGWEENFEV